MLHKIALFFKQLLTLLMSYIRFAELEHRFHVYHFVVIQHCNPQWTFERTVLIDI